MKYESEGIQASQKSAKTAAELESMIMARLREHPECDSAAVLPLGSSARTTYAPCSQIVRSTWGRSLLGPSL